jgi:dephospho-CoA kinase
MNCVLCFSGGIGSGKTSLAAAVSERADIRLASFGRFVRHIAEQRGMPGDRDTLQNLGASLIDELGWQTFCRTVVETAGWKSGAALLVDGIRHVPALEHVAGVVAPLPTKLIFVDVPSELRQVRLDAARPEERTTVNRADAHSTEKDVHGELRGRADLILDGTRSLDALVGEVCERYLQKM